LTIKCWSTIDVWKLQKYQLIQLLGNGSPHLEIFLDMMNNKRNNVIQKLKNIMNVFPENERFYLHTDPRYIQKHIIEKIAEILGISNVMTNLLLETHHIDNLAIFIKDNKDLIQNGFDIDLHKDNSDYKENGIWIKIINKILQTWGFSKIERKRCRIDTGRLYTYSIKVCEDLEKLVSPICPRRTAVPYSSIRRFCPAGTNGGQNGAYKTLIDKFEHNYVLQEEDIDTIKQILNIRQSGKWILQFNKILEEKGLTTERKRIRIDKIREYQYIIKNHI